MRIFLDFLYLILMFVVYLKLIVLKKNKEKRKKVISLFDLKVNCIC